MSTSPLPALSSPFAPSIAMPADLPPLTLSVNARTILEKRYLPKDDTGACVETPEQMFWRVAVTIAEAERAYGATEQAIAEYARAYYALFAARKFLPNSPTLMNAGRPLGQLSACFVLPVEDCLSNGADGIYDTLSSMAVIHQSGGGTGFSFSRLRPKGAMVRSTTGVASGPVSFMRLYDASTDAVKQGGTRRGANMGILRVDHPDVLEFIALKQNLDTCTNFNISVGVTDVFMAALAADAHYDLVDPHSGAVVGQQRARAVWEMMIECAWRTGEPGVFFIDAANRANPVPHLGAYEATNPCGEQALLAYDVCNLGSINVGAYVTKAYTTGVPGRFSLPPEVLTVVREFTTAHQAEQGFGEHVMARIDWPALTADIRTTVRFLDGVLDVNKYPLPEIAALSARIRRIGLGVMGFADLLVRLGVPYNSERGIAVGRALQAFVDAEAKRASVALAAEKGTFPEWERSIWGPDATCARAADGSRIRPELPLRNCNITTVAPTGTISIIAGCSSGLEPFFAVAFMRNQAGVQMPDVNADFVEIAQREGWYSEGLMAAIAAQGTVRLDGVPVRWQDVFVTANAISPEYHVRMQAAFQAACDSAISKTINLPPSATHEDVRVTYGRAYALGCKGVTVYRDGCRQNQVLSTGATAQAQSAATPEGPLGAIPDGMVLVTQEEQARERAAYADAAGLLAEAQAEVARLKRLLHASETENLQRRQMRSRPEILRGTTIRKETPLGTMFVNITEDAQGNAFEVFLSLGKAGGSAMADAEAIGRLVSLALRSGIPLSELQKQLRGISSDRAVGLGPSKVLSMPDAVGQALALWAQEKQGTQQELLPLATVRITEEGPGHANGNGNGHPHASTGAGRLSAEIPLLFDPRSVTMLAGACPDCSSQLTVEENCQKCHVCGYSDCG